jgi:hypothetical protein
MRGGRVVLTDKAAALPLLRLNCRANFGNTFEAAGPGTISTCDYLSDSFSNDNLLTADTLRIDCFVLVNDSWSSKSVMSCDEPVLSALILEYLHALTLLFET